VIESTKTVKQCGEKLHLFVATTNAVTPIPGDERNREAALNEPAIAGD
jgi:hypothetical protein